MPRTKISLNCLISGHDRNRIFRIKIAGTEPVSKLKESIKLECMELRDVDPRTLTLYKMCLPDDNEFMEKLEHLELPEPLPAMRELSACFEGVPDEHLHVLVVLPTDKIAERKHELSWDNAERATKHRKILDVAPSLFDVRQYRSMQAKSSERLLDFRRPDDFKGELPDKHLPPIGVLFPGFGKFLDIWRAASMPNFKPDSPDFDLRVGDFVDTMSRVFADEGLRRTKGLKKLNMMFPSTNRRDSIIPRDDPRIGRGGTGSIPRIDGHSVFGPFGIPCIVVKFKNEGGGSSAIPIAELAAYYACVVNNIATNHRKVVNGSRMPTLGITIVGPIITFFALAYVGSPIYVPLTTGLWCLPVECGGSDHYQLYTAFKAASVLIESIVEEAKRLTDGSPACIMQPSLPQLNRLTKYHDFSVTPGNSTHIEFRITGLVPGTKNFNRHIYLASSSGGRDDLVIKLTRSYSPELHAFCAHHSYAPKLYGYERLAGGIIAVAMEYIKGELLTCPAPTDFQDKWSNDLREMVKTMHDKDYVHGDLRAPNFLCVEDQIMMLDFDWGGKVGEALYPHTCLHPEISTGRDMSRLEITKEDDDRVLEVTLNYIRGQVEDYHEHHYS